MMITAVILNISLVLLFQTGGAYDKRFEELNTADISVNVPSALTENDIEDDLKSLDGILSIKKIMHCLLPLACRNFKVRNLP